MDAPVLYCTTASLVSTLHVLNYATVRDRIKFHFLLSRGKVRLRGVSSGLRGSSVLRWVHLRLLVSRGNGATSGGDDDRRVGMHHGGLGLVPGASNSCAGARSTADHTADDSDNDDNR